MTHDILPKHIKYIDMYKSNRLYWGLGIENELYLEFENKIKVSKKKFLENHRRERYSVDYYTAYKSPNKAFNFILDKLEKYEDGYSMPLLINSNSFTRTDKSNNSKTLYTKLCEPNPKYDGKLLTELFNESPYLKENYDKNYVYEGDVIEIITLDFFNTTLKDVINELEKSKEDFIRNVQNVFTNNNIFSEYGTIDFIKENHPFGIYLTNMNNIGIFNNGTLHFNITLPTMLDSNNNIIDRNTFEAQHKQYIRLIQFVEPLLLSIYGSPDPFSYIKTKSIEKPFSENIMYSSCSQRCAVSRYISIGTYDTSIMKRGKLLTDNIKTFKVATEPYGWYNRYHQYSGYNKLEEIGYDINYNKHINHGIEIRIFDHITDINLIKEAFVFIILLGDYSLSVSEIENPIINLIWNDLVIDCMKYGSELKLNDNYIALYNNLFNHTFTSKCIKTIYYEIFNLLKYRSTKKNDFSKYVLEKSNRKIYTDV